MNLPESSAESGTEHHELGACGGGPDTLCEGNENTNACEQEQEAIVITKQEDFLNKIHSEFLKNVNPTESGLVDVLRGVEALSSDDEQAIDNENTRKKKARKFWKKLRKIPEEDFANSFVPELKKVYPHVVSGLAFQPEKSRSFHCLHHAMKKRIKLKHLIDIIQSAQGCTKEKYFQLTRHRHSGEREWEEVFQILQTQTSNSQLCHSMEQYLHKKKINHPERFREVAAGGFACTCHSLQPLALPSDVEVRLDQQKHSLNINTDCESSLVCMPSPFSRRGDSDNDLNGSSGVKGVCGTACAVC